VSKEMLPTGSILPFASNFIPDEYLECDGSEYSRSSYPDLYSVIGLTFGGSASRETFRVPDLRGLFIRGMNNGRGLDLDASVRLSP